MPERQLYLYVTTPVDEGVRKFHLADINGKEQIPGLFHYRLKLRSEDGNVDFRKLVEQSELAPGPIVPKEKISNVQVCSEKFYRNRKIFDESDINCGLAGQKETIPCQKKRKFFSLMPCKRLK